MENPEALNDAMIDGNGTIPPEIQVPNRPEEETTTQPPQSKIISSLDPGLVGVDPQQYNLRNPAVKRLMREAAEMAGQSEDIYARPLEENLFEWHFTIRGARESDFGVGCYHGRIILPTDYPMKPPSIILLTPNGRFETGTKICLSISSYHPETWRPSWSIRTALVALISFMTTESPGAIGSVEMPSEERQKLAKRSLSWVCPSCGPSIQHLKYVCEGASGGVPPKPQQLFRIPHDPSEGFDRQEPVGIERRGGDNQPLHDDAAEEEEGEEMGLDMGQPEGNLLYSLAIGGVLICIGGILINRLLNADFFL